MRRILILLVLMFLLVACGREDPPMDVTPIAGEAVSLSSPYFDAEVNQPAADFTLTNQDNQPISLSDLRGSFVLLNFIYTSCPDVCPLMTAGLRRIEDELGGAFGSEVQFVSITLDPEFDTPERLKSYASAFGVDFAGWDFLTGDPEAVRQIADEYQQTFEMIGPQNIDHTALTVLIDPLGIERHRYWGTGFTPDIIIDRIAELRQTSVRSGGDAMAARVTQASTPSGPPAYPGRN